MPQHPQTDWRAWESSIGSTNSKTCLETVKGDATRLQEVGSLEVTLLDDMGGQRLGRGSRNPNRCVSGFEVLVVFQDSSTYQFFGEHLRAALKMCSN